MPLQLPDPVRSILVCQLRQIGDVLLSTPSIELLAKRFPEAAISLYTEKKCVPVVEHNPHLARIWPIDKQVLANPMKALQYYWKVARQDWDIIVDFQQLPRCQYVVAFSGAPVRLTFTPPWQRRMLYTHWTQPLRGYAARAKASVLQPLGIEWNGEKPRLYLTTEEKDWAARYLAGCGVKSSDILVTVDPSHRRVTRRWPAAHFGRLLALARQLEPLGKRLRFLILWGPGEQQIAQTVAAEAAEAAPEAGAACIVPEEMLSLRHMAGCIDRAALHLGNCSAPRHFAVALDTPTLVVLGATSHAWTYPSDDHPSADVPAGHRDVQLGLDCQPCNLNSCPKEPSLACVTGLEPEAVLGPLSEMLGAVRS